MTYEFADKELENRFHKYCQKYNVDLINPDYVLFFPLIVLSHITQKTINTAKSSTQNSR